MKNRPNIPLFISMIFWLLPTGPVFSQSLPIRHYSVEDNLPNSFVNCILQDSHGFFWFGTEHGLSRFNGSEFRNYHLKDGLPQGFIMTLLEDRHRNLWIGTLGGGLVRRKGERFKTYTIHDGLSSGRIFTLTEDRDGILWIGTSNGLTTFDGEKFSAYNEIDALTGIIVTAILFDKQGNLWVGSDKGLFCSGKSGFIHFTSKDGLPGNNIRALMMDHKGNIWIATTKGLGRYSRRKNGFISYTTRDGLPHNSVKTVMEDRNRMIWIGTESGLSLFSNGRFRNFSTENGLPNDSISALFEGREGNIWIATNMGVCMLHSLRILNYSTQNGLAHNLIWFIMEDKKGNIWIGTDKGLSRYSGGTFKTYTSADGLAGDSVYWLMTDKNSNIWMATNNGVSVYRQGEFTNFSTDDGLPHNIVLSFEEDGDGTVWIGTLRGICRYIGGKIAPPPFKQIHSPIHTIMEDSRGNLWLSGPMGLRKISDQGITRYSTKDGLINNRVRSLYEDSREKIWISTHQGLGCFREGTFTNYTTAEGLSDNMCSFTLEDDSGNIWIGTGKGVDRFDGTSFKNYSAKNGLASSEMSQNACLRDREGNLWFGTINGLSRFSPSLDRVNMVPPPVYLTGLKVMANDFPITPGFRLPYDQNYLEIDYIGLCFSDPESVVYKYRLIGTDGLAHRTTNRSVSFSSLAPGTYTFQVTAENSDGYSSTTPAEIHFTILPPFWKTWWFNTLGLLFILLLMAMLIFWHINRVKTKMANEARNKQLVMAQRMELMGVLAGGTVHDLKNLLTIIIGYSKLLENEYTDKKIKSKPEDSEALDMIQSSATTAFQVVKQILAFSRQSYDRTAAVNLRDEVDGLLEILKVSIPPEVKVLWETGKEEVLMFINPVQFKQLVMNLCLNAVHAMPDGGELKLSLRHGPDLQVILEVSDTGTGMDRETRDRIFEPLFTTKGPGKGSGLGLFVVKQIVDEYNGTIDIRSEPGEGSTFTFTFPHQLSPLKNRN
jgi:ligand-binding sensor domain-containing protein/signal transduction histidine kinase